MIQKTFTNTHTVTELDT